MGYKGDEGKTKDAFNENFWFKTGDLASHDDDRFFTVHGRIKELVRFNKSQY